jgi:hypothetical protein
MAKTIYYQSTHDMLPRPGVKYATTYYKQTLEQRKQLTKHIRKCSMEIAEYLDVDPEAAEWHTNYPLKGFPKSDKQPNRTTWEIVSDMVQESQGRKRDGLPKDYAQAPIERWNKLFKDTDYEIHMEQNDSAYKSNFSNIYTTEEQ